MSNPNLPAISEPSSVIPTREEWSLLAEMAKHLVPTGFLPDTIRTPEQAVLVMLKGKELGVPPLYAMSNIVIVKGKPTVSAEMMLALIYRDHGKKAIRVKSSDDTQCTVEYRLDGWDDVSSYTFTMDQAKNAGLDRNPTWRSYPAAMLRARCISAVARMAFPESIAGMYVPGELGDDVTVNDDGEIMSVSSVTVGIDPETSTGGFNPDVDAYIEPIQPPQEDPWQKASARLHAVAAKHGITHDDLHNMAVAVKKSSVKDFSRKDLIDLADKIDSAPDKAQQWATSLRRDAAQEPPESPQSDEAAQDDPVPVSNGELNFSEDELPTPRRSADSYTSI